MRGVAVKTINQATTLRNWIIGCYIVEYEQNGSDRLCKVLYYVKPAQNIH